MQKAGRRACKLACARADRCCLLAAVDAAIPSAVPLRRPTPTPPYWPPKPPCWQLKRPNALMAGVAPPFLGGPLWPALLPAAAL